MYFTTFNHDDDTIYNDNDTIYNDEVCLICWEPSTTNKNIDKMKSFLYASSFYTSCTCNGKFHHDCLLKWTNMSQSCPICRIKIDTYDDKKLQLPLTFNIFTIQFNFTHAHTRTRKPERLFRFSPKINLFRMDYSN